MTEKKIHYIEPDCEEEAELLKSLLRARLNEKETKTNPSTFREFIPVYIALVGLFLSTASVYADMKTQVATIDTRLTILNQVVHDIQSDIREKTRTRQK